MNTRQAAEAWYKEKYGQIDRNIRSSKLYKPEESRAKEYSWWIEIKESKLEAGEFQNILLQKRRGNDDFFHLKIPNLFLIDNKNNLGYRETEGVFSLIISAEPQTRMVEKRGSGKISLLEFCKTGCDIVKNAYTAVIKKENDWWVGWIEEVPGVNCQEKTRDELKKTLGITLKEAVEFNRQDALSAAGSGYKEESIAV